MASEEKTETPTREGTAELLGLFEPPSPKRIVADAKFVENDQDSEDGPGSDSHMMNLFAVPRQNQTIQRPDLDRQSTAPRSNLSLTQESENTPLLSGSFSSFERSSHSRDSSWTDKFASFFSEQSNETITPSLHNSHKRLSSVAPSMPSIRETSDVPKGETTSSRSRTRQLVHFCLTEASKGSTIIGSFMYLLYHIVFCLALGSAIIRPNNPTSILGIMTKTAALGSITASSVYWFALSDEIPALYPTVDLFLAPFFAHLGVIVDQTLHDDDTVTMHDNDRTFLATFGVLCGIGICFSGSLLVLASVFKLANLGSFLPFPVICGFFAAVGVLTWTLSVTIDAGQPVGAIIFSGDVELISYAILHHIPGVVIAIFMKYLGPKHPFYVIMVALCAVGSFYFVMFLTGTSFEEAREQGWFWTHSELVYKSPEAVTIGFNSWAPPAPFGLLNELCQGVVHWGAVSAGLSYSIAMGFLYLIRCSVHGTALKKNIPNLSRRASDQETSTFKQMLSTRPKPIKLRTFSDAVDIEQVVQQAMLTKSTREKPPSLIKAKPTNITLKAILFPYGFSQIVSAFVGGFAITPSVAASTTMFSLGADGLAPQIGSSLLLLIFYLTDFQLVQYIPKPAFSSMLVLAFIDMTHTWFYKSFFKTKDTWEWMVVPLIVIAAFALDLLSAVFLGIAFSTLIFVASFFRSGVVKYVANGMIIHSTIERPFRRSEFLNQNGDLIQVMVLQNYLFFGNANSVYHYIGVMFQSLNDKEEEDLINATRRPDFLILDLTLVTGMDTSTSDIFNDIKNLCASNECKLFMAGLSPNIRTILSLGGFKADTSKERSKRQLRFFASLDAALGKAEDMLLDSDFGQREPANVASRKRSLSDTDQGFRTALRYIDEEHEESFALELLGLQEYTSLIELKAGDELYNNDDSEKGIERGLFFIESGMLKVEHDTSATATRGSLRYSPSIYKSTEGFNDDSLTRIHARSLARHSSLLNADSQTFRLARLGPGWVAGTLECVSGISPSGNHVALTDCRLHHLPYSRLEEIEKSNPSLVLCLYKLLSHLLARRQEATIGQLATLHSIMSSPAQMRSLRRVQNSQLSLISP